MRKRPRNDELYIYTSDQFKKNKFRRFEAPSRIFLMADKQNWMLKIRWAKFNEEIK